jgi:hypothetical protein
MSPAPSPRASWIGRRRNRTRRRAPGFSHVWCWSVALTYYPAGRDSEFSREYPNIVPRGENPLTSGASPIRGLAIAVDDLRA